ncbi:hypothetical protein [Cesiribacter sp. SM1]|uniref:hypothetical protein n=1 Tax=Cesiribacter sp. SM1 TaxID=2861196 RepID=UPI001CD3B8E5|nr:hypothetical protein [Cesiribacter sp. SM1]
MFRNLKHTRPLTLLLALVNCFLLAAAPVLAQRAITPMQQQAIAEVAIDRVEVFTKYLALLAKEQDSDKRKAYERYISLSFVGQETPIRVYNDLLPGSVVEANPILDQHVYLEEYLGQLSANYANMLNVSFSDHKVKCISYSDYLKQYYVVVTAQRELSGMYRNGARLIENKAAYPIDFFVQLELGQYGIDVGSLFGFEPHKERHNYTIVPVDSTTVAGQANEMEGFREAIRLVSSKRKIRIKRGKSHVLQWSGGLKDDIVEVELIPLDDKKGKTTVYFEPLRNEKSARVWIHDSVRAGLYRFRITNITTGHYTQTGQVKVKRKFLFLGSAAGPAALQADAAFLPVPVKKFFKSSIPICHS